MRRNLVGKKLPQTLTLVDTASATVDLTSASRSAIETAINAATSGWNPATNQQYLTTNAYWTEVTPASAIQAGDLIAVAMTDLYHSSNNDASFGFDLSGKGRHWTNVANYTTQRVCDNSAGGGVVDFTMYTGPHSTNVGQGRFTIRNLVGTGTIKVELADLGGLQDTLYFPLTDAQVSGDCYATQYDISTGSTSYSAVHTLQLDAGASCTVDRGMFDDDDGTFTSSLSGPFRIMPKPVIWFVDSSTGDIEQLTPKAGQQNQNANNVGNTGADTWADLQAMGVSTAGAVNVYDADDLSMPLSNVRIFVGNDVGVQGVLSFPNLPGLWTESGRAVHRFGQLRRAAASAIIRPNSLFDDTLDLSATLHDTYVISGEDQSTQLLDGASQDIKGNGFTADSIGIEMGQCAFIAPSVLTTFNYSAPPSSYYNGGESSISGQQPSSYADVRAFDGGDVGVGPAPETHQKGLWRVEAYISLRNPTSATMTDPAFYDKNWWQFMDGTWAFLS